MLTWFSRHVAWPLWEIDNGTRMLPALRELEATQWLTAAQLAERQWAKLRTLVADAYEHCEYYRTLFDDHGIDPSRVSTPTDLRNIPILTKRAIQQHHGRMVHREYDRSQLIEARTGGSTGEALTVLADRHCRDLRNAAAMRSDRWAGWQMGVMVAALWGNPPVADNLKRKLRSLLHDRTVYCDTMNMSDATMSEFVEVWRRKHPQVLFGHSHSLYIWANWLKSRHIRAIRPRGVISTSMMLIPRERAVIEEVFGCQVTDRYGCEEVGLIACECERHDGLHLNLDHLFVEFIRDDGSPADPGEPAILVVTDLVNRGMPLIRYNVEDVAIQASHACACGRGLPLIRSVVGRVADFLMRPDGSLIAGVSLVERTLTAFPGIEQMQIVQESLDDVVLNIVRMNGYGRETEAGLLGEFRRVFGPLVRFHINYAARIPQQSSGKYRFAICRVNDPVMQS